MSAAHCGSNHHGLLLSFVLPGFPLTLELSFDQDDHKQINI